MKSGYKKCALYALTLVAGYILSSPSFACTGIQLKAKDNTYVSGRTVEFGIPLQLSGLVIPRNYAFSGTLPDGSKGLQYKSKYAVIGASAFGEPSVLDGVNEKGLTAGTFYFSNYAEYALVNTQNAKNGLSPTEFTNWVLTQFATVDEVKQGLNNVVITPTALSNWGGVPPFHYVVYDKTGQSIAIEPINGKLVVRDNPIGTFTNSPTFDWHLTNLSNYMNLSPINTPSKTLDGFQLKQFGQGSGLHGLPGDFSPPSRFVRAAIFSATATPSNNADQAVFQAFHILNQFDIPEGAVRSSGKTPEMDMTIATTVKDPQHGRYYFKTYQDQSIKVFSLNAFDLNNKQLTYIDMSGIQPVIDISNKVIKH